VKDSALKRFLFAIKVGVPLRNLWNKAREAKIGLRVKREASVATKIFDLIVAKHDLHEIKKLAATLKSVEIKNFVDRLATIGYLPNVPPLPQNPTIAVVIPHFNHTKYLGEALESLAKQTELPNEVIIVDDQSSDIKCVKNMCCYYKKKLPLKLITPSKKLYTAGARQLGAEQATSDLITPHDADDISHPRRIELTKKVFKKYPNTLQLNFGFVGFFERPFHYLAPLETLKLENHIISTKQITSTMKGNFVEQRFSSLDTRPVQWGSYNFHSNYGFTCSTAHLTYPKALTSRIKWLKPSEKSFTIFEDYDFAFMLLMAGQKSLFLDLPLLYYRRNSSTWTSPQEHEKVLREL